jgi:hypothetical protein
MMALDSNSFSVGREFFHNCSMSIIDTGTSLTVLPTDFIKKLFLRISNPVTPISVSSGLYSTLCNSTGPGKLP